MRRSLMNAITMLCFAGIAGAAETRFAEAEQMTLKGCGIGRNAAAGYSGHGEFALSYVRLKPGQKSRRPKELTLSTRFGRSLPPGKYLVVLRYIDPCRVRLSMGGTTLEHDVPPGKRNEGIAITTQEPAEGLRLQVLECGIRVIFDWIFITGDPTYVMERSGSRSRLVRRLPQAEAGPVVESPNAVANASFEAGAPSEWSTPYQNSLALFSSMLDNAHATHGTYSLKVPITRRARSPKSYDSSNMTYGPVQVRKGETYRFSFQARSEPAAAVAASARLDGTRKNWSESLDTAGDWRRLDFQVGPAPEDGLVSLDLSLKSDGPGHVWLDEVYFGALDAFALRRRLEAGPVWRLPGNIMIQGGDAAELAVRREPDAAKDARFVYKVYDVNDSLVSERSIDLSNAAEGTSRLPLPLPNGTTGAYRMHFRIVSEGDAPEWRQACFSVLPDTSANADEPIGVYGSFAPQALQIYQLAGFRSTCTLSAGGQIGSWRIMEPEFGKGYHYFDEDIENAKRYNVHVIANLHTVHYAWPKGLPLSKEPPAEPAVRHRKSGYYPLSAWRSFVNGLQIIPYS